MARQAGPSEHDGGFAASRAELEKVFMFAAQHTPVVPSRVCGHTCSVLTAATVQPETTSPSLALHPRVQPSRCSGELLHESVTGALCPGSAIDEQVLKLLRHPRQCAVSTCCAVSVYGAALPLCAHDHIGRVRPQDPQDPQHGSSPGRLL